MKKLPRIDVWITLAGILGYAIFLGLYDSAFPTAALGLKRSRSEIRRIAQDSMRSYGYDLQGYHFVLDFYSDWMGSVYLQNTLGIPQTNQLIQAENLTIWYWQARWFRPLQQEEFALMLAPDGRVVGFDHAIPEDQPGASLSESQARAIAMDFLARETGWQASQWEETSASSTQQPGGRVDHDFEWKRRNFNAGESQLRQSVQVQGDQIGAFGDRIKVPEEFTRRYLEQRNRADFIVQISLFIGNSLFLIAAITFLAMHVLNHGKLSRTSAWLALLASLVTLAARLNLLPLASSVYDTTQPYTQFWVEIIFSIAIGVVAGFFLYLVVWSGAERTARALWPRQDKLLSRDGDRWDNLGRSAWRGVMLGGMWGAYVVLFYLVATRLFGSWTPMGIDYTSAYASPLPFIPPLASGLIPALSEEMIYRLTGVALILGLTRRRWLALLVPGALWAFAHLSYVRDPYYLRGIELTISAVVLIGLFFLAFDLTTVIFAHMTYNALLGALPMLRSGEAYFVFSGVVVVLALLAPALVSGGRAYWRRLRGIRWVAPRLESASPADLAALEELPIEGAGWEARLADPGGAVILLRAGEEVCGVAAGATAGKLGKLEIVYVQPEWRRRFWGSRLVDAACQEMERLGATEIQASLPFDARAGLAFLGAVGWKHESVVLRRGAPFTFDGLREASWQAVKEFLQRSKLLARLQTPLGREKPPPD